MDLSPKLKICGITTREEIAFLNELDVDYVGFVFAKSRRQVTPEAAKDLRDSLRKEILTVGVFVNEDPVRINEIAEICDLDIVQLHGQETEAEMRRIQRPIWNAVGVTTEADIESAATPMAEAILLDYRDPGSGQAFDWSLVPDERPYCLVLAGGIHPDNAQNAIKRAAPDVIDVSSGVEKKGKKSKALVKEMIRRVKGK